MLLRFLEVYVGNTVCSTVTECNGHVKLELNDKTFLYCDLMDENISVMNKYSKLY